MRDHFLNISLKRNGTFASTLLILEETTKTAEELKKIVKDEDYSDISYDSSLQVNAKGVVTNSWGPTALKIVKTEMKNGNRIDTLVGTDGSLTSSFGYYKVNCLANVVTAAQTQIDTTNQCRRLSIDAVLSSLKKDANTKDLTCTAKARANYKEKKTDDYLVFARCNNNIGYRYVVHTKTLKPTGCKLDAPQFIGTLNINK